MFWYATFELKAEIYESCYAKSHLQSRKAMRTTSYSYSNKKCALSRIYFKQLDSYW